MCFPDEARQRCEHQEEEEPDAEGEQRCAQRDERQRVLSEAEHLREEADAPCRIATRALEVIVELRVLELREVERRRVLHEANAHAVREKIAE